MIQKFGRGAIFAAMAGLSLLSVPVFAGMPEGSVAAMNKAASEFVELLKDSAYKTQPPRLSDARAKPLLEALTDRKAILGERPYTAGDIQPLLAAFSNYFALTKVYMEFKDPAGKQSPGDNDFVFQDELTLLATRMLDTSGAISEALTDSAATTPAADLTEARKAEIAKLRSGVTQMFSSIVSLLQNPRYSKENKVVLARSLADNAAAFRDMVTVAERGNIVSASMQAMTQTPREAEDDMNTFINVLKSEECTGICALK